VNVLLSKKFMQSDIEYIKAALSAGVTLVEPEEYTEEGVLRKINEADALLGGMFSESLLKASKHIKLFQIPWTGVDNIDFSLLRKYEIDNVCNSHSNAFVVAEHAIALYFSAAKKIPYHDRRLRHGDWNRISPDGNEGGQLREDDIDCEVYCYNQLEEALENAGAVFVAIPLTSESTGLFDQACFGAMSQQSILINVARGAVIDEESLYRSLHNRSIYGAGIDTWYNYPKPPNSQTFPSENYPFHDLDNLVLSPHRAGYVDSGFPHLDDAIQNINNLQAGAPLINRISAEYRY